MGGLLTTDRSAYTERMNEVELKKQKDLYELEKDKNKNTNEQELQKQRALYDFEKYKKEITNEQELQKQRALYDFEKYKKEITNEQELQKQRALYEFEKYKTAITNEQELQRQRDLHELEKDKSKIVNEQELQKQRDLYELEKDKNKIANEQERQKLELQKQKATSDYSLKRGELLLGFQTDIRKIEAELIKTRMMTQSTLFQKFIDFMRETLATNDALISQQTKLYEIASKNDTKADFFMEKAEKVDVLGAKQLIEIGAEKVKELNLESSTEMKYLESRLEQVLGTLHTTTLAIE
ncbi:unnamed protein product [Adineta steineri]|uniref:Uncharacterized protein n=1 Tax=Adineta steineri TaxID=433720 RepID=A0A818J587_9BILA|nr:unnamed protein product [Adineta steineri]CAF3533742.1 unnamed protein product [Adineta steineri]